LLNALAFASSRPVCFERCPRCFREVTTANQGVSVGRRATVAGRVFRHPAASRLESRGVIRRISLTSQISSRLFSSAM